jgi:predicted DNA-binding protein YlxM (UPF0122 family)
MDTLEMTLLFDYYGDLLTPRQQMCFDLRHNQDLSLAEIAEELNVSRQGVHDNLSRAEALLRNMEEKTGCVRRDLAYRKALQTIQQVAETLLTYQDDVVSDLGRKILSTVEGLEE